MDRYSDPLIPVYGQHARIDGRAEVVSYPDAFQPSPSMRALPPPQPRMREPCGYLDACPPQVLRERDDDEDSELWTWETLRERVHTGDLLYFMCRTWTGALICCLTCTRISHVAMVVRLHADQAHVPAGVYLLEAVYHADDVYDYLSQTRGRAGVRLVGLYEKLASDNGEYVDVHVHQVHGVETLETARMARDVVAWLCGQGGLAYDASVLNLGMAWFDAPGAFLRRRQPVKSYICSEIVARGWVIGGLLDESTDCEEVSPEQFYYHDIVLKHGSLAATLHRLSLASVPRPSASQLSQWRSRPVRPGPTQ